MSKIGRKPISIKGVVTEVTKQTVTYKGSQSQGEHVLPDCLEAVVENDTISLQLRDGNSKNNRLWGLHRALLHNKIAGAREKFKKEVQIVGLGYKGVLQGNKIEFSLGYSHKINFEVPSEVSIAIDKTGQNITVTSSDKFLAGDVAQKICALRAPEPYKGTGVKLSDQIIHRKAGKTKGN